MKGLTVAVAAFLLAPATAAHACGADQISVENFQSEIDAWSDGSGHVVRLNGFIANPCQQTLSVRIAVTERSRRGLMLGVYQFWIDQVTPGGKSIELLDQVPYRADAASYEAGVVRIK